MFAQSSLIYLYYLKFKNAGAIINRPCVILFRLNALHLRPRRINLFTVYFFICTNTNIILFLCLKLLTLFLVVFLLLSYTQKKKPSFLNFFSVFFKYYINYFKQLCQVFFICTYNFLSIYHNNYKTNIHIHKDNFCNILHYLFHH